MSEVPLQVSDVEATSRLVNDTARPPPKNSKCSRRGGMHRCVGAGRPWRNRVRADHNNPSAPNARPCKGTHSEESTFPQDPMPGALWWTVDRGGGRFLMSEVPL